MSIYARLFWSKGSLVSLVISLLYSVAQYFYNKNNLVKAMTTDEISFMVTVSLLIYILTTILLNVLAEVDKLLHPSKGEIHKRLSEWRETDIKQISQVIDERFTQTITKFANIHEGFINGMYNNYPHNFTSVFDKETSCFQDLNRNSIKSLYLWRGSVGVNTYLELANELLKLTTDSIYATTYYDNYKFIEEMATNKKVRVWLDSVNNKHKVVLDKKENNNSNFKIFRVHIFEKYINNEVTSKDFDSFIKKIKYNKVALKNYREKQVSPCDYFYTWTLGEDVNFYGEYIIFDEQVMLKYDEDFRVLEVYIGDIVKKHANSFKPNAIYFDHNKEEIMKILENI